MGVLSDLVLASDSDVERIGASSVPSQDFPGIDVKGIDTIKLGTLHSLLTGKEFDSLLPAYDPVLSVSEEGPWIFRVPDELTAALVNLPDNGFQGVVDQWASTEEFELDGWPPEVVADVLREMQNLARRAEASKLRIFLWMSL